VTSVLRTIPAILAALALGAHFLRAGSHVAAAACLVLVPAFLVPHPAIRRFSRIVLAAGAALWLITAWRIARFRLAAGEPYLRMLAILGAVAAFTALAAWVLPSVRRPEPPPSPPSAGGGA
jgi:hypothetical protein